MDYLVRLPLECADLPRYTVRVYDIDSPKEFDSYECFFYERGFDLEELLEEAKEKIKEQFKS